jgi:hypothetical protein
MARKTQEELDARLGAAGGSRFVHSDTVGKRKVPNPDYDKYDAKSQETIELDIEQWRTPEGHVIQAVHMPDGSWDVIQDEPPAKPASASSTAIPADAVPRIEGTPLPGGGFDNEAPVQVWRRPDGTVVKTEPLTGPERTKWEEDRQKSRNPGQKTDAQLATEKKEADAKAEKDAANNRGTTTLKPDGRGGTIAVTTYPDGRAPTTAPVPGVPSEAQNKYREVKQDPTTGKWSGLTASGQWEPIEGGPGLPDKGVGNLKDLPAYQPDLTKPGAGLIDYARQLDEYMAAHPEFTWEKRQQVLTAAQAQARQVTDEWNIGARALETQYQGSLTQRGQDINQATGRANLANQHIQNANALIEKFAPYLGVTPGDAGKMFMGMMASQLATATMYGGMREPPPVEMDPRLTAFAGRMPGGQTAAPPPAPAPTAPSTLTPEQADRDMAAAVRAAHAATGQPLPAPLLGPRPEVAALAAAAPYAPPPLDNLPAPGPEFVTPSGSFGIPAGNLPGQGQPVSMSSPALQDISAQAFGAPDQSMREQAMTRASFLGDQPSPQHVALGSTIFGGSSMPNPYPEFSLGGPVGPAPMVMQSRIVGLTPEVDEAARRELIAEMRMG